MRAFLALALPRPLGAEAHHGLEKLGVTEARWRIVPPEHLHLTLRFLGEVAEARLSSLHERFEEAAATTGVLALRVRGAGAFPSRRPRTLWLGIEERNASGALAALASRLEDAARAAGFAEETRKFFPHVTLARARGSEPALSALASIGTVGEFDADALVLFRSITGPGGARYDAERRYALAGR